MRIAVIDLGTNTFNLLIVEKDNSNGYSKIKSSRIPVKLGEGSINKGFISEIPFKRGVEALKQYARIIQEYKVDKIKAMATSAIRSASNGIEFVKAAKLEAGIDIEIIDGNREAELIYYGNREAVKLTDQPTLIMDIGGGSTEFIIGNNQEIFWKESYLLGAARLLELINPSDPITQEEIANLFCYFDAHLKSLKNAVSTYNVIELVGSSGAFDSIVEMMTEEYNTEGINDKKTEYTIQLDKYFPLAKKVINSSYNERLKISGLIEMRVDMITISCLFVNYILNEFEINKMRVSTYSLKEGVIFST